MMVIVGPKPMPYVDDDDPWSENGFLNSSWIKSTTDRKKEFRGEEYSTSLAARSFNFQQLEEATRNFHPSNELIGGGGFWRVYKGVLRNGRQIAVKRFISISDQGKHEFLDELGIVSTLDDHPNLVKMLGCCEEHNQLLLVYEHMEKRSLDRALFGILEFKWRLDWQTRFEICLGIAKGLAFLHEESTLKIIHGDINPMNILLDKDRNAKISGFANAIHHDGEEPLVTKLRGTSSYMAPEYAARGHLTYKADVYSFGVVMLEILSGKAASKPYRPNLFLKNYYRPNDKTPFLLDQACVLYHQGKLLKLIDPDLKRDYKVKQAKMMLNLAMLCTNLRPAVRPKMSEVVSILEGKTELKTVHYSDDGFGKTSASAEKSDALHEASCSKYDITCADHEKEPLAADDHADIQEFDFEDAASTMQLHDQTIEEGQKDGAKLLMERNFPVMAGPSESSSATLFMDHHVTKMNEEEDKGKLEYVEPTFDEDGKLRIEYSEEEFEEGCNEWKDSLVGLFVGDNKPVIMNTILNKENVETLWGVKGDDAVFVFSMEDDYFLIRFKYVEDKIKVLESGPWHIENRPLILREWNWKLKFDKINEMKITLPIWVKMYNLPLFLWTTSYLSKVGSALGTPLYSDEKTKNKEMVDVARLCIQVDASKSLPNSLNISIKGVDYEIRFEYEWKPLRCANMEDTKQN